MYGVSARFLAAVRAGYTDYCEAEFYLLDELLMTVPILTGSVNADKTADIRRSCDVSFSQENIAIPGVNDYFDSPLWPIGNEIRIKAGVQFDDGTRELVPMGMFRVSKPKFVDTGGEIAINVQGYDRSRAIKRARFTKTYRIANGTDYSTAIMALVKNRIPTLNDEDFVEWMVTDGSDGNDAFDTPEIIYTPDDDPLVELNNLAKAVGAEFLFDGNGKPVLRPEPDPQYAPSTFDYIKGNNATFDSVSRDMDDEETYNGVIVVGNAVKNVGVARGAAWDINPASPTYFDPTRPDESSYGPVPYFFTSTYIKNNTQALKVANAMLPRVIGVMESVQFDGITNYAHEESDVVQVTDLDIGVNAAYLLESLRFGLGFDGSMSGQTRRRRIA